MIMAAALLLVARRGARRCCKSRASRRENVQMTSYYQSPFNSNPADEGHGPAYDSVDMSANDFI